MALTDTFSTFASVLDDITGLYVPQSDLETETSSFAMRTVVTATIVLIVLIAFSVLFAQRVKILKLPLFSMIAFTMALPTILLIYSTVSLNLRADSGGPVHWHADFEIWACGNEFELRDPTGFLSNKIGTAVLHEHDDHRIHLEGVVVEEEIDASLGKFMHVIGGAITDEAIVVPLNADGKGDLFEDEVDGDGPSDSNPSLVDPYIIEDAELGKVASFRDGDLCGSQRAEVQTFVYSYNEDDKTYSQRKLTNPRDYVIFDDSNVPPGDCIIFEFGPTRDTTDKLCEQYGIRDIDRCEEFGVEQDKRSICELREVQNTTTESVDVSTFENIETSPYENTELRSSEQFESSSESMGANDGLLPSKERLDAEPCAKLFDDQGNQIEALEPITGPDGEPLNPETDCTAYLFVLDLYNQSQQEATEESN